MVDDRQNILKNRKWYFIIGAIVSVCFLVWSVRFIWNYFHPGQKNDLVSASAAAPGTVAVIVDPSKSELRYVGKINVLNLGELAVFSEASGRLRYEYGTVCSGPWLVIRCKVDGKIVTINTGTIPNSGGVGGILGNGLRK